VADHAVTSVLGLDESPRVLYFGVQQFPLKTNRNVDGKCSFGFLMVTVFILIEVAPRGGTIRSSESAVIP